MLRYNSQSSTAVGDVPVLTDKAFLSGPSPVNLVRLCTEGVCLGFLIEAAGNVVACLILLFIRDFVFTSRPVFF